MIEGMTLCVLKKDGLALLEDSLDQSSDRSENVTGVLAHKPQLRTVLLHHPRGLHDSLVQAAPPAGTEVFEAVQDRVFHAPALVDRGAKDQNNKVSGSISRKV